MYHNKIPHGIMFHHFHGGKHIPSQGSISSDDLVKILEYIGVKRFLSPSEWLEGLSKKALKDEDLCLTFDDGLLSQADIALPVLEHYGLRGFWFVYSSVFEGQLANLEIYRLFRTKYFNKLDDFYEIFFKKSAEAGIPIAVEEKLLQEQRKNYPFYSVNDIKLRFLRDQALGPEKYEKLMDSLLADFRVSKRDLAKDLWMANSDLKYLSDGGHNIGLHSYSHPTALADLSFKGQLEEYQKNYFHLEKICGKNPVTASHPCNSYNEDTVKVLEQLGIQCGFRANMFPRQGAGKLNASNFEIAREDHANLMATLKA